LYCICNNALILPLKATEKAFYPYVYQLYLKTFIMEKFALLARLEAKPGKEQELQEFLKSALPLAEAEQETIRWYALQIGPSTFGIFDTFAVEEGRQAHLDGEIAAALMANAATLLAKDPVIEKVSLLAVK
jgi:quinol monooxygenase YgiN